MIGLCHLLLSDPSLRGDKPCLNKATDGCYDTPVAIVFYVLQSSHLRLGDGRRLLSVRPPRSGRPRRRARTPSCDARPSTPSPFFRQRPERGEVLDHLLILLVRERTGKQPGSSPLLPIPEFLARSRLTTHAPTAP